MDFVSDHWPLFGAIAAALVALMAWVGDRRRLHRANRDRVGIMPWRELSFWATLVAVLFFAAAAQQALGRG